MTTIIVKLTKNVVKNELWNRVTLSKQEKTRHRVQALILAVVEDHPSDLVSFVSEQAGMSRQGVLRHVNTLIKQGCLLPEGKGKGRRYQRTEVERKKAEVPLEDFFQYDLIQHQDEDLIWGRSVLPLVLNLPSNVLKILHYGFTEMVNNAIDHSEGTMLRIHFFQTDQATELYISDNGIGIFNKIQQDQNLVDPRQALIVLSKGKYTTDKVNHTGQGIFFTSRMMDKFSIFSEHIVFSHDDQWDNDYLTENKHFFNKGTTVYFKINHNSTHTTKEVFDRYADSEYDFSLTNVPVKMAETGEDLVSRSQAKRLMARLDQFKTVILDFEDVEFIGQAFADEIFRVFHNRHPEVDITPLYTNEAVSQMIQRAIMNRSMPEPLD